MILIFSTLSGNPRDGIRLGEIPAGTPNCQEWQIDLRDDTPESVISEIKQLEFDKAAARQADALQVAEQGYDYYDLKAAQDALLAVWGVPSRATVE